MTDTHHKDVLNAKVGFPVLLESIDADLTIGRHIGVEYPGEEEPFWGSCRKVFAQY